MLVTVHKLLLQLLRFYSSFEHCKTFRILLKCKEKSLGSHVLNKP